MFNILRTVLSSWIVALGTIAMLLAGGSTSARSAESGMLAWDSNSEPDIAGYKVYYGISSGNYLQTIDAGNTTTATVLNLSVGKTYYFVVKAYNTAGLESLPSNEASLSIPIPNQAPSVTLNSPTDGETFITPTNISLSATAQDSDGTISRVEFFNGATKLGEVTTSPFIFTWAGVEAGNYTITARAFDDQGLSSTSPAAEVTVAASGDRSRFAGFYTGVMTQGLNGPNLPFNLFVSSGGRFTGRAVIGALSFPLIGRFTAEGIATVRIPSSDSPQQTLLLQLCPDGISIAARFTDGSGEIHVLLSQPPYSVGNPAPQAGKYTLLLGRLTPMSPAAQAAPPVAPEGWGFATLVISKSGTVRVLGRLADRQPFAANALLRAGGNFAIQSRLYQSGLIAGEVAVRERAGESDGDGVFLWIKPAIPEGHFYAAGFSGTTPVQLSRFEALAPGQRIQVLSPTIPKALLTGGDLESASGPIEKNLTFSSGNAAVILNPGADRCRLRISPETGLINGSFVHPADGQIRPIAGVLFQKKGIGAGAFPGLHATGRFDLTGLAGGTTP